MNADEIDDIIREVDEELARIGELLVQLRGAITEGREGYCQNGKAIPYPHHEHMPIIRRN